MAFITWVEKVIYHLLCTGGESLYVFGQFVILAVFFNSFLVAIGGLIIYGSCWAMS